MFAFPTREERADGAILLVRWLPPLVQAFERGVVGLGLQVTRRSASTDPEGRACPTIVARGKRLTMRLGLRNTLEDFLTVDREAEPVRLDRGLEDPGYARRKIADVVEGRLAILRTLDESPDLGTARERLDELADRFEWLRAVFVEGVTPEKPVCKLVGEDGNVFAVISRVRRTLEAAGQANQAAEFVRRAFEAKCYDEVLWLCGEYVEVR